MSKSKGTICPACAGSGVLEPKHRDRTAEGKRFMALKLLGEGYSYRQIMRLCGWKSVQSVTRIAKGKR